MPRTALPIVPAALIFTKTYATGGSQMKLEAPIKKPYPGLPKIAPIKAKKIPISADDANIIQPVVCLSLYIVVTPPAFRTR